MRPSFTTLVLVVLAVASIWPVTARAQDENTAPDALGTVKSRAPQPATRPYKEPTQKQKFHGYLAEMYGPYALGSVTIVSGIHQAEHVPPDWQEGTAGFGERFASNFGTSMANATARYALGEALREDTLYYRCTCAGFWPRLSHSIFSTFVAKRGPDGHKAFGLPELVSPYAGPFMSVYLWYPRRYSGEDALRMGNHGVLDEVGTNISIEFLPSILGRGARAWMSRLHLRNPQGASRRTP